MPGSTTSRRFPNEIYKLVGRKWTGDADKIVQEALQNLSDVTQGLPTPHAVTHKGSYDSVAGTQDPTTVRLTNIADPGTAELGMAPIDHVHELENDTLEALEGIDTYLLSGVEGLVIYDPVNYSLLEQILKELRNLIGVEDSNY